MPPIPRSDIKDLINWQAKLPDTIKLSKLALPGTHNSAACHLSFPSVQCQGASVTDQLEHGVRFLDIRVATTFCVSCGLFGSGPDDLQVIHGNFPVRIPFPLKLSSVLDEVYDFLDHHKSETVVVSLKLEGASQMPSQEFADLLWGKYIHPAANKWYLKNEIPQLGHVRSKAILFRRFGVTGDKQQSYGLEASWWQYNTTQDERGYLVVQDWCEVQTPVDIAKKSEYITDHLKRAIEYNSTAVADNQAKLYINFCSGSNFWNPRCWPKKVARGVAGISQSLGKSCGIVIIDFADDNQWQTVRTLVKLNG